MKRTDNSEPVKKNRSSMQVLKTLMKLMEDDYTMEELVEELNRNEPAPVFNNSIISKYINTCRYCGINIPKIHNKYIVANTPFGINISDREYELLQSLQKNAQEHLSIRANKKFKNVITRLSRYFNRNILRAENASADLIEYSFIKAAEEKYKICLMLKTGKNIECCPVDIVKKNGKKYFRALCKGKETDISYDRLSGIEILRDKFCILEPDSEVVFKLTGGLASRYELRPHESILYNCLPDYIVISNKGERLNDLLSRLMRYDSLCSIEKPESARKEMRKLVNNTLANYGEY